MYIILYNYIYTHKYNIHHNSKLISRATFFFTGQRGHFSGLVWPGGGSSNNNRPRSRCIGVLWCVSGWCFEKTIPEYHLVICYIAMENPLSMEVLMGKSSINGPFSMAMSNNQRVVYRSG